jgi:hypothetical protein
LLIPTTFYFSDGPIFSYRKTLTKKNRVPKKKETKRIRSTILDHIESDNSKNQDTPKESLKEIVSTNQRMSPSDESSKDQPTPHSQAKKIKLSVHEYPYWETPTPECNSKIQTPQSLIESIKKVEILKNNPENSEYLDLVVNNHRQLLYNHNLHMDDTKEELIIPKSHEDCTGMDLML